MAIELIVDVPVLKGEKGDKGDTGEFSYEHLEEVVTEHLDDRFEDVNAELNSKVDAVEGSGLVSTAIAEKLLGVEDLGMTLGEFLGEVVTNDEIETLVTDIKREAVNYIDNKAIEIGTGDMLKSVYDRDDDGVIDLARKADDADTVGGNTVNASVPANAVFTDTTYGNATIEAAGLMSSEDKIKLNGVASGAQVNSVTGVKGTSEIEYRTGDINISKANIGLGNVDNKSSETIRSEITAADLENALGYSPSRYFRTNDIQTLTHQIGVSSISSSGKHYSETISGPSGYYPIAMNGFCATGTGVTKLNVYEALMTSAGTGSARIEIKAAYDSTGTADIQFSFTITWIRVAG